MKKDARAGRRPNLLVIYTDQQSMWTISACGGDTVSTPNIDRLAAQGARFTQFHTCTGVCTPSRGAFFTGRYPWVNGAWENHRPLNRDEVTFGQVFREAGYATGFFGKWHLDGESLPGFVPQERSMGFSDCAFMYNRGSSDKIVPGREGAPAFVAGEMGDAESYPTDFFTRRCLEAIRRAPEPFCHVLSIRDPHPPMAVRPPYDRMYPPAQMPLPETFYEENPPAWARAKRHGGGRPRIDRGGEARAKHAAWLRGYKSRYCGMVKCLDDNVGFLLGELEKCGRLENTIVVFSTDHGELMGEHGLVSKRCPYDAVYRIPLLMCWPGIIPAGTVVERLVSVVDFQPTILSLAGLGACGREQGRDFSGLLRGGGDDGPPEEVFIHFFEPPDWMLAGIITPEYQLTLDGASGDHVLFDRRRDPLQVKNLFREPEMTGTLLKLIDRVIANHRATGSPLFIWLERERRALVNREN